MTEAELQHAILDYCQQLHPRVRAVHLHDSRRATPDTRGLPDLFLIGAYRCCWRELKPAGGRPRGPQSQWLHWLRQAGQDRQASGTREIRLRSSVRELISEGSRLRGVARTAPGRRHVRGRGHR